MKKIEEVINIATQSKRNIAISSGALFLFGYIIGFIMIKF
jgi:hypothetical protein